MTTLNIVRFRVKPGREQDFLDAHRTVHADWPGLVRAHIIRTGDQGFCLIAERTGPEALAAARRAMIANLNGFRDTLDDLGEGKGVTDAVSGPVAMAWK